MTVLAALTCRCCLQTVVIDSRAHMLGRLASVVAKQLLSGQHIVRPTCTPATTTQHTATTQLTCSVQQHSPTTTTCYITLKPCCLWATKATVGISPTLLAVSLPPTYPPSYPAATHIPPTLPDV